MSEPIPDKAQVSIDFPDKFYMGSFGRESRFDVAADQEGLHIHLDRPGDEKRHVGFHVHHSMLVVLLRAMGDALSEADDLSAQQRQEIREALGYIAERVVAT